MATVYIPALLQPLTGGTDRLILEGATVRELVAALEARYPGLADQLTEQGNLRRNIAIAVDGEIVVEGLLTEVLPESEVHFVGAIRGGKRQSPTA